MTTSEPSRQTIKDVKENSGEGMPDINYHNVKKAALILRALNHKLRQQIIKFISEGNKLTVTEIYVKLKLEQSVASQHLAILRLAGIVTTERDGKYIYYSLNRSRLSDISAFVEDLFKP